MRAATIRGFTKSPSSGVFYAGFPPVFKRAVALWRAGVYDGTLDALLDLSGNGLHARLGSAVGADTNDPLRLQYAGAKCAYFPGSAGNQMSVPRPVASVDYTITYHDGTTDTGNSTADPLLFGGTDVKFAGLKVRSIRLNNNSGGALVGFIDFNLTAEPYATYVDPQANTWTFARSATGRKLSVVDRDLLQLGTDDYLEVADSPLLSFGAGQPLTVFAAFRQYATPNNFGQYIAKASALSVGYHLESHGTNLRTYSFASDGTNTSQGYAGAGLYVSGTSIAAATIRSASGITSAWRSGITASILGNITGDLSNTAPLRIGRGGTGSYQDFEFFGAAVFREALTADDLRRLTAEMGVS